MSRGITTVILIILTPSGVGTVPEYCVHLACEHTMKVLTFDEHLLPLHHPGGKNCLHVAPV
jgi:hypothetical protein